MRGDARDLRVGFIGLGNMGLPMAMRLQAAGYPLLVHDISAQCAAHFLKLAPNGQTLRHYCLNSRISYAPCFPVPSNAKRFFSVSRESVQALNQACPHRFYDELHTSGAKNASSARRTRCRDA